MELGEDDSDGDDDDSDGDIDSQEDGSLNSSHGNGHFTLVNEKFTVFLKNFSGEMQQNFYVRARNFCFLFSGKNGFDLS